LDERGANESSFSHNNETLVTRRKTFLVPLNIPTCAHSLDAVNTQINKVLYVELGDYPSRYAQKQSVYSSQMNSDRGQSLKQSAEK
jgi:hypothetical protein